jgi:PucR C-terminal helix-turn-helix domain/GGDEF-like domain
MGKRGLGLGAEGIRSIDGARGSRSSAPSLEQAGTLLADRLGERRAEIRAATATRVYSISDPGEVPDPAYLERLNGALAAAIDQRLAMLELGERHAPPIPAVLLAQARLDARDGVLLDTVLRRYFAGNALFGDFLAEEAERAGVQSAIVRQLLGIQATLGDRLLAAVSAEYDRETKSRPASRAERRRECVKSLLAGELVDRSPLDYEIDGHHHLALMMKGENAAGVMRRLADGVARPLLAVCREDEPVWACWLGAQRRLEAEAVLQALAETALDQVVVTVGEAGEGLAGWRFSHRQAKAALPVAERTGRSVLRYSEVAVLASVLRDDLVATSLRRLYLEPIERARDGGAVGKETLRAYFAAERNISSTAAALGVDRRTVTNRIRALEDLFGCSLKEIATDLELALQLDE